MCLSTAERQGEGEIHKSVPSRPPAGMREKGSAVLLLSSAVRQESDVSIRDTCVAQSVVSITRSLYCSSPTNALIKLSARAEKCTKRKEEFIEL